jgi:hypothetical protein
MTYAGPGRMSTERIGALCLAPAVTRAHHGTATRDPRPTETGPMMTLPEPAVPAATPTLRLIHGGASRAPWWERRSMFRDIVGGCADHWWKPTARRTAACTCDRF